MAISTTLTTAPTAPTRDDPDNFRSDADDYVDWHANDFVPEMNTIIPEMNTISSQVSSDASSASYSADVAQASANFVGEWGDQTGAATVPISVAHDGVTWILLSNMADITSEEPEEGATYWQRIWTNTMVRQEITSATTIDSDDHANFIDIASGTFTQTIAAISGLISGWYCIVRNSGTGLITINPSTTETIDGELTQTIRTGETRIIQANGTNFKSILINSNTTLIQTVTASADAAVDFTDFIDDDLYTDYVIKSDDVFLASATTGRIRVGTGSTPTWQDGSTYDYSYAQLSSNAAAESYVTIEDAAYFEFVGSIAAASGAVSNNLTVKLLSPSTTTTSIIRALTSVDDGSMLRITDAVGAFRSATPITALRIYSATSTFTGTFKLYGVK